MLFILAPRVRFFFSFDIALATATNGPKAEPGLDALVADPSAAPVATHAAASSAADATKKSRKDYIKVQYAVVY